MSLIAHAESIDIFRRRIKELHNAHFPVWEMEWLTEFVAFAVGKLSPLQVGDTACLAKTPEIDEKSGWRGFKHFLVEGRRGVIRELDWRDGKFQFLWEPDNQTWIDSTGVEEPVVRPYSFMFSQDWLKSDPL